jgi:hypothetical protein
MSFFRPTLTVTDPEGRIWEIYVSRIKPPRWKPPDYRSFADGLGGAFLLLRFLLVFILIEIPLFVVFRILWPLLRIAVSVPRTLTHGLRSKQLRVEAVSFHPWFESHLWMTTKDHVARVVEQVAAGLEAGQVAKPLGAEFRGSQEMVAASYRGLNRDG